MGELIAVLHPGADPAAVQALARLHHGSLRRILKGTGDAGQRPFYRAVLGEGATALREALAAHKDVACCYLKPEAVPAAAPNFTKAVNGALLQLDEAPRGHGVLHGWRSGAKGAGVRVIDVELGWRLTHEDLAAKPRLLAGTIPLNLSLADENHGTAVLGVLCGEHGTASGEAKGIGGICDSAQVDVVSVGELGSAAAIHQAASFLEAGDVLLLNLQRPGPAYDFAVRADQRGYIPVEWSPDDLEAIRAAAARGIIVVSPAGNGGEDLDAVVYDVPPADGSFPEGWRNPFRRGEADSGSVIVGAGAPPNVHGRTHGGDRTRLEYSNYGLCVDVQAWAEEVTSTGYGDLYKDPGAPANRDRWYTNRFNGCSAAATIVAGCLASLSGVHKTDGARPPLSGGAARFMLRRSGSPQRFVSDQHGRIGNRIDMRGLLDFGETYTPPPPLPETEPDDPSEVYYGSMARLGTFVMGAEMDSLGVFEEIFMEPYPIIHTTPVNLVRLPGQAHEVQTLLSVERVQEFSAPLRVSVDALSVPDGFTGFAFSTAMPTADDSFTLRFDVSASAQAVGAKLRLKAEVQLSSGAWRLVGEAIQYVALAPPTFLAIDGLKVPATQEVQSNLITLGDQQRAWSGSLMSSVRGFKRSWSIRLEPQAEPYTSAYRRTLFSDVNTPKLLSGNLVPGEAVPVLVSPSTPDTFWANSELHTTLTATLEEV